MQRPRCGNSLLSVYRLSTGQHTSTSSTPRMASCIYCGKKRLSDQSLPFYRERPTYLTDAYYCGCHGWG